MSHFSLLVTGADVEKQLAPYHEYECTGNNDEYVQNVSKLEELKESYFKETKEYIKDPSGKIISKYDDMFFQFTSDADLKELGIEPRDFNKSKGIIFHAQDWKDGHGYRNRVHHIPEGYELVTMIKSEAVSFLEHCEYEWELPVVKEVPDVNEEEYKWGYILVDSDNNVLDVIKRTNPNAEWDWYTVGGRWNNFFKCKKEFEFKFKGKANTRDRIFNFDEGNAIKAGFTNIAYKKEIDFDARRNEFGERAADQWDKVHAAIGDLTWKSWDELKDTGIEHEAVRELYHAQETLVLLKELRPLDTEKSHWFDGYDDFLVSREDYISDARNRANTTWAILHEGNWIEKGAMGWFGMSSGEEEQKLWNEKHSAFLDSLSDNTLLTIIDCHI